MVLFLHKKVEIERIFKTSTLQKRESACLRIDELVVRMGSGPGNKQLGFSHTGAKINATKIGIT